MNALYGCLLMLYITISPCIVCYDTKTTVCKMSEMSDYFHVVTYSNMEEDAIVVPAAVDHLPTIS